MYGFDFIKTYVGRYRTHRRVVDDGLTMLIRLNGDESTSEPEDGFIQSLVVVALFEM